MSILAGCTPSYNNAEGRAVRELGPIKNLNAARAGVVVRGLLAYTTIIEDWRNKGGLEGLEV